MFVVEHRTSRAAADESNTVVDPDERQGLLQDDQVSPSLSQPSLIIKEEKHLTALFGWMGLALISMMVVGSAVAYDSIAATTPLLKKQMNLSTEEVADLYSVYHLPNLALVFFGGVLTDRIGVNRACLLFSSLVVIGTCLFASLHSFAIMLLGRIIFGIGAESLYTAQLGVLIQWFSIPPTSHISSTSSVANWPKLAFACTLALTATRFGTIIAFDLLPTIAETSSLYIAFFTVACVVIFSFLSAVFIGLLNHVRLKRSGNTPLQTQERQHVAHDPPLSIFAPFKQLFKQPFYYLLTFICVFHYGAVISFSDFSTDFLSERWGFTPRHAAAIQAFSTMTTILTMPFFGYIVDKYGRRSSILLLGVSCLLPAHLFLMATHIPPTGAIILSGIAYSLVAAAVWPSVAIVVPPNCMNSAVGFMMCLQNTALFVFPWMLGALRDTTGSYSQGLWVFMTIDIISFIAAISLRFHDAQNGDLLELPADILKSVLVQYHSTQKIQKFFVADEYIEEPF